MLSRPTNLSAIARDLYERAHGVWIVLLVVVIVIGAPIVEELVYRGLIHGTLLDQLPLARYRKVVAILASGAFFALIHFRPIEYPGLFAFGLVLATCMTMTDRIGMAIVAHMAFNATGLFLVAR